MDIVNSLVNIVFDRIKPIQLPEKDVKSVVLVSRYYIWVNLSVSVFKRYLEQNDQFNFTRIWSDEIGRECVKGKKSLRIIDAKSRSSL